MRPASPSLHANAYEAVLRRADRFARDETAAILIEGESGTGKTTLARRIHERSPRSAGPFQHVVLSTMDDGVSSSELFGHVAGAFTDARRPRAGHFATASNGTLFLDEIGKASLALQAKLLHALEYGEIHPVGSDRIVKVAPRIIAASNIELLDLVRSDRFLPDLYARLEHFRVRLPPLRERRADVPALVMAAIRRHAPAAGYRAVLPTVDPPLMAAFQRAKWPNNVRQLDGAVHRLLLEAEGAPALTMVHCVDTLSFLTEGSPPVAVDQAQLRSVVSRSASISDAARTLGIDRKTLRRKLAADDSNGGVGQPSPQ